MTASAGDATCSRRRKQSLIDVMVSAVATLLLWPFPIARATLSPGTHAVVLLVACVIVQLAYYAVSGALWHQTAGMRFVGMRLASAEGDDPTRLEGVRWGGAAGLMALWYAVAPASACKAGVPERVSGTRIVSTGDAGDASG